MSDTQFTSCCCCDIVSVIVETAVCFSELFLTNFSTRSLPPFRRSSVAAPTRSCLSDDAANEFCVVEVTADTFSSVVFDPTKVTPVHLCQSYCQC